MMTSENGNKIEGKNVMGKPKFTWAVWNRGGGDSGG
jgi:hypothetical protein